MGQEYRLVSEDEWQDVQNELAWHKAEAKRLEVEGARLENEVYNLRWQYSHEDPNADEPECVSFDFYKCHFDTGADEPECDGEWIEHAKVHTVWRYDADGNLIYKGPPKNDPGDCPKCCDSAGSGTPQRPHESLVWAIFYAAAVQIMESGKGGLYAEDPIVYANSLLKDWKFAWPESKD